MDRERVWFPLDPRRRGGRGSGLAGCDDERAAADSQRYLCEVDECCAKQGAEDQPAAGVGDVSGEHVQPAVVEGHGALVR